MRTLSSCSSSPHFIVSFPAFRFPVKLAISAFVALVAVYHVSSPSTVTLQCQNISVPLYKSFYFLPPDGSPAGRAGCPHTAHSSCRYWREHCLPAARLWDRPVRRQNGGGENRHLLHVVAGGYVWHFFFRPINSTTTKESINMQLLHSHFIVCYICATTLSCLVSLVMLMRSMILHR